MISSIIGFAYDCKDADALADFYANLLGLEKTLSGGGWAGVHTPQGIVLAFQTVDEYVPPVWPWKEGHNSKWHILISKLMIYKKRLNTLFSVAQQKPVSNITIHLP